MNETINSPRQKYLLNLISQHAGIKQIDLLQILSPIYGISRATLLRDLNLLVTQNLIKKSGSAQTILYYPIFTHPLLHPFSVDRYFADSADQRLNVHHRFNFTIFPNLHTIFSPQELHNLQKNTRGLTSIETQLSPYTFKRELERFCVELSWKSSEIEGNTYTLFETETLLTEHRAATGKTEAETQMILNHKNVFDTMLQNRNDFTTLSISSITQLHNLLVTNLNVPTGIRLESVGITGTTYLPLDNEHQIREALEQTIKAINQTQNPWEKALIAITLIPYIQVFSDGNKRTGRMLGNAILLAHNLLPISYRSLDKEVIKKALIIFYEQNTLLPFKQLFIDQIIFANSTYFRTNTMI